MHTSRLLGAVCSSILVLVPVTSHATSIITYDGRYITTTVSAYGGSSTNDGIIGDQINSDGAGADFNPLSTVTSISTCEVGTDLGCGSNGDLAARADADAFLYSTATPFLFTASGGADASGSADPDIPGAYFSAYAISVYSMGFTIDSPYTYSLAGSITNPFPNVSSEVSLTGGISFAEVFNTTGSFSTSGVLLPGDYSISAFAFSQEETGHFYDSLPGDFDFTLTLTAVPLPPALWLFGSGLMGLIGISRRKKTL